MQVRRRGISDVITSLVLILATVSLATVFFFWALGYMGQAQTATATGINQNNGRVQEQFAINQVRFWSSNATSPSTLVSSGDMVTVYIRNFGDIPVTIDHLYYDGVLFQACSSAPSGSTYCFSPQFSTNCVPSGLPLTTSDLSGQAASLVISARALGCVNVQLSRGSLQNWNVGETHTIIVASTRGNQFTEGFTVPTQDWG